MRIENGRYRVYVRRRGPCPAFWLSIGIMTALFVFVFFARPTIRALSVDMNEEPASAQRMTLEVTFDALEVNLVELSRTKDAAEARVEAARYVPRGAAGYVVPGDGVFLVLGAGFDTAEEAEKVRQNLNEEEGILARTHRMSAGPVTLRVTSTQAQLDALTGAEDALRSLTGALRAHALALDTSEAEPVLIRAALSIEARQAAEARKKLEIAAGQNPNPVAASWLEQLYGLEDALAGLSAGEQDTSMTFSSKLKYAFLEARIAHVEALSAL